MTRTLNATTYGNQRREFIYLYALDYSGGSLYFTTGPADVVFDSNTYQAVGGAILHEPIPETADRKAQGITLNLFGVDQTVIAAILLNQFRGHDCRIYIQHYDPDTGVAETPDLIWRGQQDGDYKITENRDDDGRTQSVSVSTRVTSAMAVTNVMRSVRSNISSHQEMLRRAGLSTTDLFFGRVATLADKNIYWGTEAPDPASGTRPGRGEGGKEGGGGGAGGGDDRPV